jgi:hypothetical protein
MEVSGQLSHHFTPPFHPGLGKVYVFIVGSECTEATEVNLTDLPQTVTFLSLVYFPYISFLRGVQQ